VLFNPSTDSKQVNFSLPLFMAGIDRNSTAMLQGGTRLEVDSRGYAAADFALNPGEVRHWAIR